MWKWIFIMLAIANMNMKRTWQGYGVKLCLKLILNILKEMKGLLLFIPLWDLAQKNFIKKILCVHQVKKILENFFNSESIMS